MDEVRVLGLVLLSNENLPECKHICLFLAFRGTDLLVLKLGLSVYVSGVLGW